MQKWPLMAKISKLKQVQDRLRVVTSEIADLRSKMDALNCEAEELAIAVRVLQRLSDDTDTADSSEENIETPALVDKALRFTSRPEGLPTTYEMVVSVLREAKEDGVQKLSAMEIVSRIDAKYWKGIDPNAIRPSLHRFAEKKRINKRGTNYSLPDEPTIEGQTQKSLTF